MSQARVRPRASVLAFATRHPSANDESEEHSATQHEHDDGDDGDEDSECTRPTMLMCYAE
jgi:hypothetical protein